jgi:hypothetical protein
MKKFLIWETSLGYYTEGCVDLSKIVGLYRSYDAKWEYVNLLTDNEVLRVYSAEMDDDSGYEAAVIYEVFKDVITGKIPALYREDEIIILIKEIE